LSTLGEGNRPTEKKKGKKGGVKRQKGKGKRGRERIDIIPSEEKKAVAWLLTRPGREERLQRRTCRGEENQLGNVPLPTQKKKR